MKIIGLVGKRCSGKGLFASYLAKKYGFKQLDFTRNILAPALRKERKPVTRENLVGLATDLRKESGPDVLAKMLSKKIQNKNNYVISGIRFFQEVLHFKNIFGRKFVLVAVKASPKIRHARALKRATKGESKLTYKEFLKGESLVTEKPISNTMKIAAHAIRNEGTKEELYKKIDKLIKNLI